MSGAIDFKAMFSNPEVVKNYVLKGPRQAVPGWESLHRVIVQLLSEKVPATGRVLVLGAGGGGELLAFASARPEWRFMGVDPSQEMLDAARTVTAAYADRIELHTSYIPDAPAGPYDGATLLLTLHCISDNGDKLNALRAVRERLVPGSGAPLVVVDQCFSPQDPMARTYVDRHANYISESDPATPYAQIHGFAEKMLLGDIMISPEREVELFQEASFTGVYLFFAGLAWRGWIMYA